MHIYSTTLISVGTVSLAFVILVLLFITPLSEVMGYSDHPSYVWVMAITVAIDAFLCIPFAYLRQQKKAIKFASLKLLNIAVSILLNIIYFAVLDGKEVGYAFYINLVCSSMLAVCLVKELTGFHYVLDKAALRRMLSYTWPILILGIAGILNQTADKMLFPYIYKGADMRVQLGIYGAASKIAMIIAIFSSLLQILKNTSTVSFFSMKPLANLPIMASLLLTSSKTRASFRVSRSTRASKHSRNPTKNSPKDSMVYRSASPNITIWAPASQSGVPPSR
jgi:O-antigen/teichoic acid export membrane protein